MLRRRSRITQTIYAQILSLPSNPARTCHGFQLGHLRPNHSLHVPHRLANILRHCRLSHTDRSCPSSLRALKLPILNPRPSAHSTSTFGGKWLQRRHFLPLPLLRTQYPNPHKSGRNVEEMGPHYYPLAMYRRYHIRLNNRLRIQPPPPLLRF